MMKVIMNSDEDLGWSLKLWKFVLVVLGIVLDDVVIPLRKMKMFFEEEDFEELSLVDFLQDHWFNEDILVVLDDEVNQMKMKMFFLFFF